MSARPLLERLQRRFQPPSPGPEPLVDIEGFCPVCEQETRFRSWKAWLRDNLICVRCESLPRERALFTVLERVRPDWRDGQVHESSPSELGGKLARECSGYQVSHFDPTLPLGAETPDGWRNEDLERQTFADAAFDLVVTQDVFEHLFEPERAVREIARTLKPDGLHVGTAPLVRKGAPSGRRARRRPNGEIEHLLPEERHHNPIDPQGSLVTIDWGYDIADFLDAHAEFNTTIWALDDLSRGIRAELIEVFVSRKGAPPAP